MIFKRKHSFVQWIGLFVLCGIASGYKRYIVEEDCTHGKFHIKVDAEGRESAGILRVTRHLSYRLQMQCQIELSAPQDYGIVASIRMIGLRTQLDGSCQDYLKIFTHHEEKILCQALLDYDEAQSYATSNNSNTLHMLYQTDTDLNNTTMTHCPGFQLSFTAFKRIRYFNDSSIDSRYFECDNGRVIWSGLTCDGHNNCGDRSDEGSSSRVDCGTVSSMPLIIAGSLMVMFLFIACMTTLVWSERKRARSLRKRLGSTSPILQSPKVN